MSEPVVTPTPAEESAAAGTDAPVAVGQASLFGDAVKTLRRSPAFLIGAVLLLVIVAITVVPGLFTTVDPRNPALCNLANSADGPSAQAWFGYDLQGCDYYAQVIYGARISITIGLLVTAASVVVGVLFGAVAGYFGGIVDSLLARVTDIFYGLPLILGALILLQSLPTRNVFTVAFALIVFGWMTMMRLVRATVISVKDADYVLAAKALGASTTRIIVRHILPNAVAPVLVYATISIGGIIAAESTLTYLGLGLQLPEISWGLQIDAGQQRIRDAAHLVLFPSAALSITVLAFILIGDALRDALDPKLR